MADAGDQRQPLSREVHPLDDGTEPRIVSDGIEEEINLYREETRVSCCPSCFKLSDGFIWLSFRGVHFGELIMDCAHVRGVKDLVGETFRTTLLAEALSDSRLN
jgi:hypothetical protein